MLFGVTWYGKKDMSRQAGPQFMSQVYKFLYENLFIFLILNFLIHVMRLVIEWYEKCLAFCGWAPFFTHIAASYVEISFGI